ncbi:hypothetical protein [Hyphomicrobium sp.]|uniref:hypothetical protein n=1 Tax=Hyphomicrobium sp. TaxID=82 RepID=UPI000F946799|nr:hypothetical protein [Hyphomicrobium sp.]RUP07639.1 MAG: hypothetical protein EKK38_18870 [Hyphomicrobium sp.]
MSDGIHLSSPLNRLDEPATDRIWVEANGRHNSSEEEIDNPVKAALYAQSSQSADRNNQDFLAGYGLAQAVPGPLFTFAAYLGAVAVKWPNGIAGHRRRNDVHPFPPLFALRVDAGFISLRGATLFPR